MLPTYPQSVELTLAHRPLLHSLFGELRSGISEFTFANIYLFRTAHHYRLSMLEDGTVVLLGRDKDVSFFMLPFGLPPLHRIQQLLVERGMMKCATKAQAETLTAAGFRVLADRDNFDYLYRRQDLAQLSGRYYHKKRNLIKAFVSTHRYTAKPLRSEYLADALHVLDD